MPLNNDFFSSHCKWKKLEDIKNVEGIAGPVESLAVIEGSERKLG